MAEKPPSKKAEDSSDSEEKQSPEEKMLWEKIDGVLKEYHLTAF